MSTVPNDEDVNFLIRNLQKLDLDSKWKPEEDYYVHIDVLHGSSQLVSRRINTFMILQDSFDPRRVFNFPTDLLEKGEKDSLKQRRELAGGLGDQYYELWKVRKNFSLSKFREMINRIPAGVKVRITRFIDNDRDINVYDSGRH